MIQISTAATFVGTHCAPALYIAFNPPHLQATQNDNDLVLMIHYVNIFD